MHPGARREAERRVALARLGSAAAAGALAGLLPPSPLWAAALAPALCWPLRREAARSAHGARALARAGLLQAAAAFALAWLLVVAARQ